MKLITYHSNKSTGFGGVETLTRSLQRISDRNNMDVIELFHEVSGLERFVDNRNFVKYKRVPDFKWLGRISFLIRYVVLYLCLIKNTVNDDRVVIFNPFLLVFFGKRFLLSRRVILVQTNKFEVTFSSKVKIFLVGRKVNLLYKYCVYTEVDRVRLLREYFKGIDDKVSVVPRGCKLTTATRSPRLGKKIVTIARIDEYQKNFKAMLLVMKRLPEYSLDIYGAGESKEIEDLKRRIAEYPNVRFCGEAVNVEEVLSNYSLFVMTSLYEGFGQTLIEARSQGLPIVAFDTFDAVGWIVKNGITGFVVPFGDLDEFAFSIRKVLENVKLFEDMSQRSLITAQETDNSVVEKIWESFLT